MKSQYSAPYLLIFLSFAILVPTGLLQAQQQVQRPSVARVPVRSNVPVRPGMDAANTPAAQQMLPPMRPAWFPLAQKHQQYLDQILNFWQQKSDEINRYRCTFKRWEYDPVFGPRADAKTFAEGQIKYAAPDKGLYRVDEVKQYQPPRDPGGRPQYVKTDNDMLKQHWVCDGKSVFEFDYSRKQLIQTELPPDMRGKAIARGPLPFLFNAKADDIKRRFWIRVITPPEAKGEYWLEAYPRTQDDAANFKFVHVVIDEIDFLPKAMVLFGTDYDPRTHPSRTSFRFDKREVNFNILAQQLNLFHREFFEPKTMSGWEKIVNKWNQPVMPQNQAGVPRRASNPPVNSSRR